jgi:hypothetical protein
MDPQKLSQLDPKLQEAYLRVMGTQIPTPQANPSVQTPVAAPQFQVQQEPIPAPTPVSQPIQGMNSEIPVPQTSMPDSLRMTPPVAPAPAFRPQPVAFEKKSGMIPVFFVIVGVVFIVIYALFWTKVFNLKLPFLP